MTNTPTGYRLPSRLAPGLAIIGLFALGLAACGNNSPTTLTSPSPTFAPLTVSGNLVFTAIGQTSQLTAMAGDGSEATGVTWTAVNPTVVSVSSSGLATSIGGGNATIKVSAPGAQGAATAVVVTTAAGPTKTISTCQVINAPGAYVVGADLTSNPSTSACITVSTTAQVQLDCQGHTTVTLTVANAHAVTVTNCVVSGATTITGSDSTVVSNSTFNGGLLIVSSSGVTVTNSTVRFKPGLFGILTVSHGTNVQLIGDTVTGPLSPIAAAAIYMFNGTGNTVRQCTLDGSYDGGPAELGVDDGVLLTNEVGDTVQGNTIRNFFDTAFEGEGLVARATVSDNIVTNVGATAFGSYWCTNWSNDVIRNNDVSQSPTLVLVYYDQGAGQCGASTLPAGFTGNQILGNRYRTPIAGTQRALPAPGTIASLPGPASRLIVLMPFGPATGNVIQGNDFGTNDGLFLLPLSGFTNGGGNTCGPFNAALSNVSCGGT